MTLPIPQGPSAPPSKRKKTPSEKVARKVELGAQTVAGGIGTAFGAAKLRDSYKEDAKGNARKVHQTVMHAARAARARGVPSRRVAPIAYAVEHGKPGFKPLVTLAGAGAVATGAHRYQEVHRYFHDKRRGLVKSAPRRADGPVVRVRVTPPPRHAARPYAGRRRVPTKVDKVKNLATIHSGRLFSVAESATDLFKAACCTGELGNVPRTAHMPGIGKVRVIGYHGDGKFHVIDRDDQGRIASRDRLKFHKQKGSPMSKSAFGVDHGSLSKAGTQLALTRGVEVVGRNVGPAARKSNKLRNTAIASGAATAAGAAGVGVARARKKQPMDPTDLGKSAFFAELSKDRANAKPSADRRVAAGVFGPFHSAVAGKKGKKLAATGSVLGHGIAGNALGAAAGGAVGAATRHPEAGIRVGSSLGSVAGVQRSVTTNARKGRYKAER